ncbi:MAG: catalase [Gammaproteobacteria bacterium]
MSKKDAGDTAKGRRKSGSKAAASGGGAARSTVAGPAAAQDGADEDAAARRLAQWDAFAAAIPHNANKALEYGEASREAEPGRFASIDDPSTLGSTLSETNASSKLGGGVPAVGASPVAESLDRVRTDGSEQVLTTNQGVPIADNQHSLKQGLRGPSLLEDFILREKITHFDHERIPERIVHARGSGAHGYFECYESLERYTCASVFAEAGKRTPVFVRFSTVMGERGSADTVRDVRGFAVKFYTDEGNWDLVGNNMPVFFIQDAMKFPDLVHAAKPEPHFQMPQAATAHDTFWDFVSLMPESTHMLMWAMSDRAIPRSYRTMQGFGVHTFRLVDAEGGSHFCKFHWTPLAGTHSLVWDEALKIQGADPDFHRRDLWEAIEAGAWPEYELGLQIFSAEDAEAWSFDVLDATKIVPEELVPIVPVGRLVLNRNPDNFFAETEQVAFCTAHIVRGLDFSADPLLAGRIHSYVDTQLSRLGGPNFHEIPINSPVVGVYNNQRDGLHRQAIHRGRVAYEPNSLGGGCPFQAGNARGFASFPAPPEGDKLRGHPERFADHYTQATLFWRSQSPVERAHILKGFRFELSKVQVPAVRERVVAMLANVDETLATGLAASLGIDPMPAALPKAMERPVTPEIAKSPALSLFARPGDGSIRTRRIALLVAPGVDTASLAAVHALLLEQEAVPRYLGLHFGRCGDEVAIDVDVTLETTPAVLYDALVVPDGQAGVESLGRVGQVLEFVRDTYRHCKPILLIGAAHELAVKAGIDLTLPTGVPDPGIVSCERDAVDDACRGFVTAIAAHRHYARETDPPAV